MTDLVASDVTVEVGGREIISDASLHARPGEVVALIGPNGAGKSTLLAALAGDLPCVRGRVSIGELDVATAKAEELARVRSVMLQETTVAFSFLVRDVVDMGRRPWGRAAVGENAAIVDAALRATDITHLQGRDVMTLSGGERARTALSRVLAQRTPVMMLDEPTAAMDIKHQEHSLGLVRKLADNGAIVVIVLHDLNAAAAYADHVVCLSRGRVVADGTVDEVYTNETLSRVYEWPISVTRAEGSQRGRLHVAPAVAEGATSALEERDLDVLFPGVSEEHGSHGGEQQQEPASVGVSRGKTVRQKGIDRIFF